MIAIAQAVAVRQDMLVPGIKALPGSPTAYRGRDVTFPMMAISLAGRFASVTTRISRWQAQEECRHVNSVSLRASRRRDGLDT